MLQNKLLQHPDETMENDENKNEKVPQNGEGVTSEVLCACGERGGRVVDSMSACAAAFKGFRLSQTRQNRRPRASLCISTATAATRQGTHLPQPPLQPSARVIYNESTYSEADLLPIPTSWTAFL